MSEDPKTVWKKQWKGPGGLLLWLLLLMAGSFVVFFCIGLVSGMQNNVGTMALFALLYSVGLAGAGFLGVMFIKWLCHWKNLRRFLFGLACLITLIALFYAEEDWRGWHAWNSFKRQWEAKGEKFDLVNFAPSPVPDNENFALTPVVASSYEAVLDKTGREVRPRNTNVVNRLDMPLVADYSDGPTNGSGNWERGTLTDLNWWQNYYRNLAAKTNLFPVAPEPQSPAQDVLLALSKYDSTIEALREASRLPDSRFPLEYNKDDSAMILLPHLAPLKSATLTLRLRAIAELRAGESDQALSDVKLMLYLNQSIRSEPFLISHLVRLAMTDITLQPIYEGLAEHKWSDAQLADLDAELAKLDYLADYEYSMRGERDLGVSNIEYLRRSRDFQILDYTSGRYHPHSSFLLHLIPASFFYRNELAIARMHQQWTLPMVDLQNRIVSPELVRRNNAAANKELRHFSAYNILARMLFPAISNAVEKFARGQSDVDLARVAIALERYRLANGRYPDSLDALAPDYLKEVPHDIINGQPLHYRLTNDGQFVLYSVGWNDRDDGGVVGLSRNGKGLDYRKGDLVWRYPQK